MLIGENDGFYYFALRVEQREALHQADEPGDEGTVAMLGEYIKQQQKQVWMYSAYQG